jgi:hypothetical protein
MCLGSFLDAVLLYNVINVINVGNECANVVNECANVINGYFQFGNSLIRQSNHGGSSLQIDRKLVRGERARW